jgi:hypothetical protein
MDDAEADIVGRVLDSSTTASFKRTFNAYLLLKAARPPRSPPRRRATVKTVSAILTFAVIAAVAGNHEAIMQVLLH